MTTLAPRTVLVVSWAPFFSGAERALVILLEALDRRRYRPVVALGTRGQLEDELRARDIRVFHIPIAYSGVRNAPSWLASVGRFARLIRRERVTLVHANDVPSFQPAGYAARLLGVPAITHVRFPDSRAGFQWFLRPGFRQALFVSAALRDAAVQEAPALFADRNEVVHDGVRLPDVISEAARDRVRGELGLPLDRPVVAFTGQIAEIKGIWEFVDAAALLISRGSPATFAVLGDDLKGRGALRRQAEEAARARGLNGQIRFLGFRPDAPRLIPAFDVVAVPSHVEPLGNATLEAMAAGRPVVGSRVGGIPEMIVDGVTGSLVPARDPAALAGAIEHLVQRPDEARAFGNAARQRAADAFGMTRHARAVEAAYDRTLAARGGVSRQAS
jgi:glycosyltransferase involved in cell wall biosynthesis